jgi:hypothetical protein
MLKHEITYEDFNGDTVTETLYFNLSEAELIEMEFGVDNGFGEYLQNIVKAQDKNALIQNFKTIVLKAYGEKSDDGKRFMKSDQIREDFSNTAAYQELFKQLAIDSTYAANFIIGIFPKNTQPGLKKELEKVETAEKLKTSQIAILQNQLSEDTEAVTEVNQD